MPAAGGGDEWQEKLDPVKAMRPTRMTLLPIARSIDR
jgi:hypothetical protein